MKYLSLLFCIALAFSCEKDEEQAPDQIIDNGGLVTLSGEWHLKSMTSFAPTVMEYLLDDYVWTINEAQDSVQVVQFITSDIPFIALEGDQTFGLMATTDSLFIDAYSYGYFFQDEDLYVTENPELDGPIYKFIRPE